jgi:effector-binding domain-containing protein
LRSPIPFVVLAVAVISGCGDDQPQQVAAPTGEPPVVEVAPEVVKKNLAGTGVLVMAKTGDFNLYPQALEEALAALAAKGIEPLGDPMGVIDPESAALPLAERRWEVLVPVPNDTLAPEGFTYRDVEGGPAAVITFKGPFRRDRIPLYEALDSWVLAHGFEPAGPPIEVYHWGENLPEEERVTEVYLCFREPGAEAVPEPVAGTAEGDAE